MGVEGLGFKCQGSVGFKVESGRRRCSSKGDSCR